MINPVGPNFLWVIKNYDGLLLHNFSIYVAPGDTEKAILVSRLIHWAVSKLIPKRDSGAKIIITGDFNLFAIEKVSFFENSVCKE